MKMCDILHARHVKAYLRFDTLFNLTKIKEQQEKLLDTIHGLTKRVIKEKKKLFEDNYKKGNVPTPSLSEIIADDYVVPSKPEKKKTEGLRDDLDDIDENDVGAYRFFYYFWSETYIFDQLKNEARSYCNRKSTNLPRSLGNKKKR